jgi:hypothetical protein
MAPISRSMSCLKAEARHQLGALERIVDRHLVAETARHARDERREAGITAGTVAVAEHDVGARNAPAAPAPGRAHGMAVHVPGNAMRFVRGLDQPRELRDIGPVESLDARQDLFDAERPVVDVDVALDQAPHQPQAHLGLLARHHRMRPGLAQHLRIDLVLVPVGVDVGPREQSCEQGGAMVGRTRDQLVDKGVLGAAQQVDRHGMAEILGIVASAVGRIEYQRQGRPGRHAAQQHARQMAVQIGKRQHQVGSACYCLVRRYC